MTRALSRAFIHKTRREVPRPATWLLLVSLCVS
jgi:hypothetical protein